MRIDDGVAVLEISSYVQGKLTTIYPSLIWDNNMVILVDAGYPGQLPLIREAMSNTGVSFGKLDMVMITHHDVDHMGSLKSILTESPNRPEVIAHVMEMPYIQGEQHPLKVAQLKAGLDSLPQEMKGIYEKLSAFYQNGTVTVDKTVIDGA